MAEKDNTSTAGDFRNKVVDLGGGIKIAGKLRLGGMQYLEGKYDCGLNDFFGNADITRISTISALLVAMILGDYPEKTDEEVEVFVKGLDISALTKVTGVLGNVLRTAAGSEAPNAPRRTPKKKAKRKKAKNKK